MKVGTVAMSPGTKRIHNDLIFLIAKRFAQNTLLNAVSSADSSRMQRYLARHDAMRKVSLKLPAPTFDRLRDLSERTTFCAQLVRHTDGRTRLHMTKDEPARLEIFETRRKNFVAEARRTLADFAKAAATRGERGENRRRPRATEHFDRALERTTLTIDFCNHRHILTLTFKKKAA
jgi:hypothetical protein